MSVTIVGGGNMGGALARAVLSNKLFSRDQVTIVEPIENRREAISRELDCTVAETIARSGESSIIVLAMKPQDLRAAAETIRDTLSSDATIVSILAGVSIPILRKFLPKQKRFVRSMPNTPMQIGEGMTALVFDGTFDAKTRDLVTKMFSVSGKVIELKDESLMNAVTAVSGSGPAYVYYFAEQLCLAAKTLGFSPDEARLLVSQTLSGAVSLWRQSDKSPEDLRKQVTSKGGTTEAAIGVFDAGRLGEIVQAGVQRASDRGRELERISQEKD